MDRSEQSLPPLSRLRPFEAAARHENFSLAAAELGMTQTAVSKQIAQFERELGTPLFERRNRAVFLTDAGRQLGQVVSQALSEIATEIAALRGTRRGHELVLHCQLCEAFYWLMPRLSRFHERHPDIELRVVSALAPLTQASEAFDVAFQTTGRASGSARLAFTASDAIFPVCAPSLLAGRAQPITPRELAAFPLVSHRVLPQDWMDWPDWFQNVGAVLPKTARILPFNSYPVSLQAAVAGQGVALGWRRTTSAMIDEGKLIRPCREVLELPTGLSVFHGNVRSRHPDAAHLLDWLSAELSD
ncbi:MAG: LysR substrate-binding domain-containing protein [Pseudomonadota bacterium]